MLTFKRNQKVTTPVQAPQVWLYHADAPDGVLFKIPHKEGQKEYEATIQAFVASKESDGWVDTPAKLDKKIVQDAKAKANPVLSKEGDAITIDQARTVCMQYGYKVLTKTELEAEIGKAVGAATQALSTESDDADDEPETPLMERFLDNPKGLTKPEHVVLGKKLGLNLMESWKEDTLIKKIQEKLEEIEGSDDIQPIIKD